MAELNENFEFEQDGKTYSLYDLPAGFVIKGDVDLSGRGLTELPDLSDVIVEGDFSCSKNSLTSLKGAPKKVGGDFYCSSNQLTSLEGTPQEIDGDFACNNNQLTLLKGAPQKVGGDFICSNNRLDSLEGAPQKVGGYFVCGNNQLTSLEGAPKTVGGNFVCSSNLLDTLKGAPETVGKIFDCFNNCLISLIDMPKMQDNAEIRCDADMARKYGLSEDKTAEDAKFTVKELYESPAYQNEVKIDVLRQVSRLREKTMQENAPKIAKTQAAFDAWLKQNGAGKNTPEK